MPLVSFFIVYSFLSEPYRQKQASPYL